MNSHLDPDLGMAMTVIYAVVSIILLCLAISWAVFPWTINAKLKQLVENADRQTELLENIAQNIAGDSGTNAPAPSITYRAGPR